ncbi:regulatory protein GemA [Elioraea sp.]|uniref:regulatory protein GemA n=1 Tax=Elioraea sp. TaxID=2185103 RepID=UPI0021DC333D|nr:regulatory protein GemA [Elioraea sp.]GIX12033.1 MAG: GemA protein [Elioraea sp.]
MSVPARLAAAIHACRRRVPGLEDEAAWRAFLSRVAGRDSLRAMSGPELGRVLDALHAAGAPRRPGRGAGRAAIPCDPLSRKVRALWLALAEAGAVADRSERGLDAWVARQCGVTSLRFCGPEHRVRLIEALKAWARRVGAAAE